MTSAVINTLVPDLRCTLNTCVCIFPGCERGSGAARSGGPYIPLNGVPMGFLSSSSPSPALVWVFFSF